MRPQLTEQRYAPKVPVWRRGAALGIDLLGVLALSLLAGSAAWVAFLPFWWAWRVAVVLRNRGQSLGRWAFDMRVIDLRYNSTPGLLELTKREGITGLGGVLILLGLQSLSATNLSLLFLVLPLLVDCSLAWADSEFRQAFHDRVARTSVVQTRRGYSLDLKLKRLFAQVGSRMK